MFQQFPSVFILTSAKMLYNERMKFYKYIVIIIFLFGIGFEKAFSQSCSEQPVRVEHYSMEVEELYSELIFDIYIPACIDDRIIGGYPVIYLLHGQDMGIEIWQEMEMDNVIRDTIRRQDIPLFYTVVPQENQYLLSLSLSAYDEAILHYLIPWIDENFNTCTERRCRSIGGLSRGALWAEKIAFENPTIFGSLGMISMPGTITDDQSMFYLTEKHKPDNLLRIRMDTGSEDNYRHEGSKAASQLTYVGYPYEYYIQPGKHDTNYWRDRLSDLFVWFTEEDDFSQSAFTITQTAE